MLDRLIGYGMELGHVALQFAQAAMYLGIAYLACQLAGKL